MASINGGWTRETEARMRRYVPRGGGGAHYRPRPRLIKSPVSLLPTVAASLAHHGRRVTKGTHTHATLQDLFGLQPQLAHMYRGTPRRLGYPRVDWLGPKCLAQEWPANG